MAGYDYADLLGATGWAAPAVGSLAAWAWQLRRPASGLDDAAPSARVIAGSAGEWIAIACAALAGVVAGIQCTARHEVVSLLGAVALLAAAVWRAVRLNRLGSVVLDRVMVAGAEVAVVVLAWVSIWLFLRPGWFPFWWLVTAPLSTVVAAVAVVIWSRTVRGGASAVRRPD